ncbi:MAG TPA: VWA domain-containing protein [Vicinamibacterales bacterium]|nr:VWA domain-containing protein [Vicinamibacterales bacterium]
MTRAATAALALLALHAAHPARPPAQKFSSRVEAVRVDVLVTQKGKPVLGLKPPDFEVLDNGVPQQVDLASFEQIPLNVVLVLDMSDSVEGERLDHLRSAGRALLERLEPADRAGLITFGHAVMLRSELTGDIGRLRSALDSATTPLGLTSLIDACYAGIALGESDIGRALVVVFSDGVDTLSFLSADDVIQIARRSDAVVYGASVRGENRAEFLRDLSDTTGGDLFQVDSTHDLGQTFLAILHEFRHRYLVSYSPRDVSNDGWHRLEVRVNRRNVTVKARPGYAR